jgi:hypothetical protein
MVGAFVVKGLKGMMSWISMPFATAVRSKQESYGNTTSFSWIQKRRQLADEVPKEHSQELEGNGESGYADSVSNSLYLQLCRG